MSQQLTLLYDYIEDEPQPKDADPPVYREVAAVLRTRGHEVNTIAVTPDTCQLVHALEKDRSDMIFNLCDAIGDVDDRAINVASLLELMEKPFTGAGTMGLSLAQDKVLAKKIFAFHDLRYPKFSIMRAGQVEWSDDLQFPLFVKPSNTDSSVGIDAGALVHDVKALMQRISYIHTELKSGALIEEFVDGREIFVGVLGNDAAMQALPIVEWDFSKVKGPKFATAEAKWDKQSEGYKAPERFPTDIPAEVTSAIQAAAVDACRALHIHDYGRVDMRLRCDPKRDRGDASAWEFYIIEANPNPYLEKNSELAMAAGKSGRSYEDLIDGILESAHNRSAKRA
jgi:D-alanine-D-alanine ligase